VTSANVSGRPTLATAEAIAAELGGALDLILDGGPARSEQPSTVIDCSTGVPRLLRDGAIPAGALAAVLDEAELPHELSTD
jgi:L-threonylcarbamoyladenylate synthase